MSSPLAEPVVETMYLSHVRAGGFRTSATRPTSPTPAWTSTRPATPGVTSAPRCRSPVSSRLSATKATCSSTAATLTICLCVPHLIHTNPALAIDRVSPSAGLGHARTRRRLRLCHRCRIGGRHLASQLRRVGLGVVPSAAAVEPLRQAAQHPQHHRDPISPDLVSPFSRDPGSSRLETDRLLNLSRAASRASRCSKKRRRLPASCTCACP